MNFAKAADYGTKAIFIVYVAIQRILNWIRRALKNPRKAAPVIGKYAIVFMLGMLTAITMLRAKDAATVKAAPDPVVTDAPAPVQEVRELTPEEAEEARAAEAAAMEEAAIHREAQYMARVLYGTALHNSTEARKAVCWCIINRVESTLFPNSIEEVCAQNKQWMGYSESNPVTQELYNTAREVLETWHDNGIRMFSKEYLFLTWSEDEIILRTTFNESPRTRYYHVDG